MLAAACELPNQQLRELSIDDRCDQRNWFTLELIDKDDAIINDLIDTIESDETLTWNRASKPTTGGYQTHEIIKHNQSKAVEFLKKIKDQLFNYTQTQGATMRSVAGVWFSNPVAIKRNILTLTHFYLSHLSFSAASA